MEFKKYIFVAVKLEDLLKQIKKYMRKYKRKAPEFYNKFDEASRAVNTGVSHENEEPQDNPVP